MAQEANEIKQVAALDAGQDVNQVGTLYGRLLDILSNKEWIPDTAFQGATLPYQASWDEWGRGYRLGDRGQESGNVPAVRTPDLLIIQVWSRDTALSALRQIGKQGEAIEELPNDERSHFNRFLGIYREMSKLDPATQELVSRPVAKNPTTSHLLNEEALRTLSEAVPNAQLEREHWEITEDEALSWGHLFNLRYRMLLVNIASAFKLAGPLDNADSTTARGGLINRTFAEMYNLRAIAGILVQLPLDAQSPQHAGPPFEMPYTLDLPEHPHDRWIQQRELFRAARILNRADQTTGAPGASGVPGGDRGFGRAGIGPDRADHLQTLIAPQRQGAGMTIIKELRILPPLAIARLGAATSPMDNYEVEVNPAEPLGFRRLRPSKTFLVNTENGKITKTFVPESLQFTEGNKVRPVAPFLEVWALTSSGKLEPLTKQLLASNGLVPPTYAGDSM